MDKTELEYAYIDNGRRMNMVWRRGKAWNRSFFGRKGATQPERKVYLRQGRGDLLLAELKNSSAYSEFHMASGERSILRMSIEVSSLSNALVLIDEVETGLHPYIQKQLMLHLQRLSLREKLQIIVTTHSPVVLESVPLEGRVFLTRDNKHDVRVEAPMRDILQKAMYGQSKDKLSVLCEDDVAEFIIRGVVDALSEKINLRPEDLFIGKNTGKNEFPAHVRTLARIQQLQNFIFVLDGDGRDMIRPIEQAADADNVKVQLLFLPGEFCPEKWLWDAIARDTVKYGELLAIGQTQLEKAMQEAQAIMAGTTAAESERQKEQLQFLANRLQKEITEIARLVARQNTKDGGEIIEFVNDLEDKISDWRNQ